MSAWFVPPSYMATSNKACTGLVIHQQRWKTKKNGRLQNAASCLRGRESLSASLLCWLIFELVSILPALSMHKSPGLSQPRELLLPTPWSTVPFPCPGHREGQGLEPASPLGSFLVSTTRRATSVCGLTPPHVRGLQWADEQRWSVRKGRVQELYF